MKPDMQLGTQTFSINAKTIISAKRKVTDIIHNDMKVDVGYEAHKDPLWWHRWFPSSIEPNAYKMSDPFNGRQMRADLKFY